MPNKSKVAVVRTRPENVLQDYQRLFELAGGSQALRRDATTILKDNISWHFPMPAANTTPWQLEGSILALRQAGFDDLVCVQNQTVLTNAFKGRRSEWVFADLQTLQHPGSLSTSEKRR